MGNRQWPYTPAEAQNALSQNTSNISVSTTFMEDEVADTDLPLTTIFHGAIKDLQIATRLGNKSPTLKFLNCPDSPQDSLEEPDLPATSSLLATSSRRPVFGNQLTAAASTVAEAPTLSSRWASTPPGSTASSGWASTTSGSTASLGWAPTTTTSSAPAPPTAVPTTASPQTTTSTTPSAAGTAEIGMSIHSMDDTEQYSDDEEMFDAAHFDAKKADIDKFLTCGVVSTPLRQQLQIFSIPAPAPEHNLNPSCKTCVKCTICMEEDGGKTFMEKKQIDCFKTHIWRSYLKDDTTKYKYKINYIEDPNTLPLPDNYQASYMTHISLRKSFSNLEPAAQAEFTERLTQGLKKKYWEEVPEEEAIAMRRPPGPGVVNGHYLPANFVLKSQGTTRSRLVLDPSGSLNQKLLKAPSLEQNIATVMRRTQCTPIVDIREAFFRITLSPKSSKLSMFLMAINTTRADTAQSMAYSES